MNENDYLEKFKVLIEKHCGMMITDVHQSQLKKYISERIEKDGISICGLYDAVISSAEELKNLVNAVVVNETYFFREEKQFKFLEEYIKTSFAGKTIVMWSAACSSGEEAYSLASLALACGAKPIVYATDIDTDALVMLKNGTYGANSFRRDGSSFKPCIAPYICETRDSKNLPVFAVLPALKEKIMCGRANLLELEKSNTVPQDETVDIIFIRNVFIYFNQTNRCEILKKLARKLKNGGLIFFSISEIGGMNADCGELNLEKKSCNSVYYFQKAEKPNNEAKIQFLRELQQKQAEEERTEKLLQQKKEFAEKPAAKEENSPKPSAAKECSAPELWEKLSVLCGKKDFEKAENLVGCFNPGIKDKFYKYYFEAFLFSARKMEAEAVQCYEKATIANPKFWPAFFQLGALLQAKDDAASKKKRLGAYTKAATILEETQGEDFTWLFGTFSSGYFYRICNENLKKEWRDDDR